MKRTVKTSVSNWISESCSNRVKCKVFCQCYDIVSAVDSLLSSSLCSPPLTSDIFGSCLHAWWVTIDVQVSESVDQEFASMCLRQHRKKKLAEIFGDLFLAPNVLLTCRHHPASVTNLSGFGLCVVVAVRVSMNLG